MKYNDFECNVCNEFHLGICFQFPLKERSRPSVSNVKSADVSLTTTLGRARHWLTSQNQSVNRTDWSTEIIQCNGRDSSFKRENDLKFLTKNPENLSSKMRYIDF